MPRASQQSTRSPDYALLIELIKEARLKSNMTQKEICDKLGKHKSYLIKIERGERRVDVVELFALCEAMGADGEELIKHFMRRRTV